MLDSTLQLHTPEGISLKIKPAGVAVRASAYAIDFGFRFLFFVAISIVANLLGEFGSGLVMLTFFALEWLYPVLFELFSDGATPGKKRMGIRVVSSDNTPVQFSASLLRNLLRTVDFLPLFYTTGFLAMLVGDKSQRLGDRVADTMVVYVDSVEQVQVIDEGKSASLPLSLSAEEQGQILQFVERSKSLSNARAIELANVLQPLHGEQGAAAVEKLKAYARGLNG